MRKCHKLVREQNESNFDGNHLIAAVPQNRALKYFTTNNHREEECYDLMHIFEFSHNLGLLET